MAVQVFNDMPDAAVHRGEPLSGSLRELNARRPLRPHFSGRAVFLGITFALHLAVALAFMQMQARKHLVEQAPPIEVSLIDEAPKAEAPPPVYTPPPVNVQYTLAEPGCDHRNRSDHAPRSRPRRSRAAMLRRWCRRWSNRWNTCAPRRPCIRRNRSAGASTAPCVLRVLVDSEGRPAQIQVERSSGFERLDSAAREAVAKFLFRPYEVNGIAQPAQVLIPIGFDRRAS